MVKIEVFYIKKLKNEFIFFSPVHKKYAFIADIERGDNSLNYKFMQLFVEQAVCEAKFNPNFLDSFLSKAVFKNSNKEIVKILLCDSGDRIAIIATKPVLSKTHFIILRENKKQNHYHCVYCLSYVK